jgi:hypothetical protein
MKAQLILAALLALLLGFGIACGGEPDPSEGSYSALLEYVVPERLVPESVWQMAPPSCEGVLMDDMIQISQAEGAPTLGVVFDAEGEPLCVDTWSAIRLELTRVMGDPSPDPMRPLLEPIEMPDSE